MYTVWIREDQPPELPYPAQPFVYAGYSGRSLTAATIEAKRAAGEKRKGLRNRLYKTALALERLILQGEWAHGTPPLN